MEPKREFTIKLRFGAEAKNPNNTEIFKFFSKQEWTSEDLSAMYRDDHCVFVRFKTEAMMRGALTKLGSKVKFDYDDGTSLEVQATAAAGSFKYVRIFGLPPEVDDRFIASVMAKYGTVQQLVRERFPVETGFPIWNGVRGVHIEMVSEIPAQMTIQHCKARIYYDGLQNKCFGCGALDHMKATCPKRKSINSRLVASATPGNGSFASVVANGATAKTLDEPSTSGMVVLNKPKNPAPIHSPYRVESNESEAGHLSAAGSMSSQHVVQAAMENNDQLMEEEDGNRQNEEEPSENKAVSMEENDTWTEAKGKGKPKRGRPQNLAESDSSESDARGGKHFIVPGQGHDLLGAQALLERSRTRSASKQQKPNDNK